MPEDFDLEPVSKPHVEPGGFVGSTEPLPYKPLDPEIKPMNISTATSAGQPGPLPQPGSPPNAGPASRDTIGWKQKFEDLINKHYPDLGAGGVEAHQPHRTFLQELRALIP